jgi:hypothetical protein
VDTINASHLLEVPFDADKIELVFEKYRYLLSEELIQRYLQYMREDTYFAIYQARKAGQQLVFVNFIEMQSIVENDLWSNERRISKVYTKFWS